MKFKNINLAELIDFMKDRGIGRLKLKRGWTTVELDRENEARLPVFTRESAASELTDSTTDTRMAGEADLEITEETLSVPADNNYFEIKAPIVGTFYRSPAPDADPFVDVGDRVNEGDTVCVVEAMKNMNEIEADITGVVKEICVKNSEMVEFDQVLFRLEQTS